MTSSRVQHESLYFSGYWRIVSFGKLTENPAVARSELRIRAYLAQLDGSSTELGRIEGTSRKAVLVPVGEIPRLHVNAVFRDGRLQTHIPKLFFEEKVRRRLNCARSNLKVIDRTEIDASGAQVIPQRKKWKDFPEDSELNGLFVAIGDESDPYATIIPAFEVLRFFYATSDVLAKAVLRDDFLDPDTNLWSLNKSGLSPAGQAILWLRKRMLDADARFLARFAFDAYALKQAQEIFLATAAGAASGDRQIRALPPFQDAVDFEFVGTPMGGPGNNRILVSRLLRCHWKPPFVELKWDRDNDGRRDPDKREERDPANWTPKWMQVPNSDSPEPATLANKAPSQPSVPARLREEEIADRFPELGKVPAKKLPQSEAKSRAAKKDFLPILQEAYTGSVIEGNSSGGLVGRAIIEALEQLPPREKSQCDAVDSEVGKADYLAVLEILKSIAKFGLAGIEFVTVLREESYAHDVPFNVFPGELDEKPKSWLFLDSDKRMRRMALTSSILFGERRRYLIELQQKAQNECSTIVLWNSIEGTIPPGLLGHLLLDCARAGAATLQSAPLLCMSWARLHHTTKGDDQASAKHFLQRIFEAKAIQ